MLLITVENSAKISTSKMTRRYDMYSTKISIKGVDAARKFVSMTAKYPKIKITLNHNEYSIDAHSIIGILSLDLTKPILLEAEGDNTDAFIEDLKPFTV